MGASNRSDSAIRAEFKQRYLSEFARYTAGDMASSRNAGMNFLFLLIAAGLGGPITSLVGAGVLLRYLQVVRDVETAIAKTTRSVVDDLESARQGDLPAVEAWLDRHQGQLLDYIDRLDRRDDEQRKLLALIGRINRLGSASDVSAADRAFLERYGIKKLKPPIAIPYVMPPRCLLNNWHHSQLARALWRDIKRKARPCRSMLRHMLPCRRNLPPERTTLAGRDSQQRPDAL
jgi:hypothetical protein